MLVSYKTAKLAFDKGVIIPSDSCFPLNGEADLEGGSKFMDFIPRPHQHELQKFIREKRGVHIEIHRNASGYYWSMCKSDGGTDLGWSDDVGPNDGGVWDTFEEALEHGLQVQLSFDLLDNTSVIKHWGNYVMFALSKLE